MNRARLHHGPSVTVDGISIPAKVAHLAHLARLIHTTHLTRLIHVRDSHEVRMTNGLMVLAAATLM